MTPASATDYCHPLELVEELQAAVPEFTLTPEGTAHPLGREHELVAGLDRMTAMTRKSIRYLLDRDGDLDLFMVVFKEPDVAMHWLWRFMDPAHPWHVPDAAESLVHGIRDTYVRLDAAVGELLERLTVGGEPPLVILMSDHGAGSQETYFHVNTWLVAQGLMRLRRDPLTALKRLAYRLGVTPVALYRLTMALGQGRQVARTLSTRRRSALSLLRAAFLSFDNVDWQRTRVYSLGNYGQLYVNLKGREPQGMVNPGTDYERVIDELVGRLETLVDPRTGARIRGTAHRKEDIYSGAHLAEAPDLVFIPDDMRYNSFGQFQFSSRRWLEPTFDRSGGHRMDGICLLWGPGVQPGRLDDAHITDLAPTALAALGVPIPDDLDGRVLRAAFEPGYWDATPIRYTQPDELPLRDRVEYGAQEEEELREHLRGLGYMA
jgi:predicted AlkP superfamily phosphohydrolase/phosphomutase